MLLKGRVSKKGQLVVPSELRKELGIEEGTSVTFFKRGRSVVVTPIRPGLADEYMGSLGIDPDAAEDSIRERRKDEARATKKCRKAGR
jgi:AbrB family looped-hinge helix DNA binding protein